MASLQQQIKYLYNETRKVELRIELFRLSTAEKKAKASENWPLAQLLRQQIEHVKILYQKRKAQGLFLDGTAAEGKEE